MDTLLFTNGGARHGDLYIYKLPAKLKISTKNEIQPINNRLVLLEGEMTGHHHSLLLDRPQPAPTAKSKTPQKPNKALERLMSKAASVRPAEVRMYRDTDLVAEMIKQDILRRSDMFIGALVVKGGGDVGVVLQHQEHNFIRILEGQYYIGRQIESVGAEYRVVAD